MKHKTFGDTIAYVNNLLDKNNEWEKRYKGYTEKIIANEERYILGRGKFIIKSPFHLYTSIQKLNYYTVLNYDLRFNGQSVAKVFVKDNEVYIETNKKKVETNKSHFNIKTVLKNENWGSNQSRKFRKEFKDCKIQHGRSKEHLIESDLLAEFSKSNSTNKRLCNIQPVRLCGMFFQFATPLMASKKEITYSNQYGGGIDILARVRHLDNSVRLCVMELKDHNNGSEPPEKVMKQAIAYASFLARLLRSDSGDEWYKIMGFSGNVPEKLIIDAVIVMPYKHTLAPDNFVLEQYEVCKDTFLELHTLYFTSSIGNLGKRLYDFQGTLKDTLLK